MNRSVTTISSLPCRLLTAISLACLLITTSARAADCGCADPVCGCEVSCGIEAAPVCGCAASCGSPATCGCEATCGADEPVCGVEEPVCGVEISCGYELAGCDGGCKPRKRRRFDMTKTPMFKVLDSLAGGIEKVLHLDDDPACDQISFLESGCDDACDVMMYHELSAPLPPPVTPVPVHAVPQPMPTQSVPRTPTPPVAAPRLPSPPVAPLPNELRPLPTPEPAEPGMTPLPADNPFEDDPLGYNSKVGSGLQPVQFQDTLSLKQIHRQPKRPAPVTRSSKARSPKSSRGGFLR